MAMFLTIKSGTVVTWTNTDDERRTVRNGLGRTPAEVGTDESVSFIFDKPGTYHCLCSAHPRMIVTVVVESPGVDNERSGGVLIGQSALLGNAES